MECRRNAGASEWAVLLGKLWRAQKRALLWRAVAWRAAAIVAVRGGGCIAVAVGGGEVGVVAIRVGVNLAAGCGCGCAGILVAHGGVDVAGVGGAGGGICRRRGCPGPCLWRPGGWTVVRS